MRPRKLIVRGFTCFRDEVTIDFTPLELFAITGPTGAGKTSLLDAMTFALYGKVFRVEREFRSIMSLGAKEVRVYFEFSVGPTVYRVTRVGFANTRPSQVAFERALGNGDWEPLIQKGAREVEAKIAALLGLDFEGFTKAVLLPQNAFGRFLQGEPSRRPRPMPRSESPRCSLAGRQARRPSHWRTGSWSVARAQYRWSGTPPALLRNVTASTARSYLVKRPSLDSPMPSRRSTRRSRRLRTTTRDISS